MKPARILLLIATTAAAVLAATAPARAAAGFEVDIEDERLMLSNSLEGQFAAADWKNLGIKEVRVQAHWWQIAPSAKSTKKPSGFKANDPNDPKYNWAVLDTAVATVVNAGLKPMLTITGPGPVWASSSPSKHNGYWKPKASEFGNFAFAVAKRYGAMVDRYLIYNEPNQKGWLQPQWSCTAHHRKCTPVSPNTYRDLVRAAVPQVHKADPHSEAVIGELAPVGNRPISDETPMAPLPFLRQMGCVDSRYHHIKSGACKHFKAASGDSFGYHPHPKKLAPDAPNKDTDDAQFGDFKRLFHALDKLSRAHRIKAPGHTFKIRLTEFGYETNPPDRANGVSQSLQNRYLQQASYIAWKTRRIASLNFYGWEDEPVKNLGAGANRYGNYQTGLKTVAGKNKPAFTTFAAPFVIDLPKGRSVGLFWGQVRPANNGKVVVQVRKKGSSTWTNLTTVSTSTDGLWSKRIKVSSTSSYRYAWTPPASALSPFPAQQFSGTVNMATAKKQKSPLKAASPA
jgi:NADH:ubiquinone oxidoreductase subunit